MTANRKKLQASVLERLGAVAPELDAQACDPARPLRQQVDLDSMDWLNFLVSLHEEFGVNIPESEYAKLVSINDILDYLEARMS
jgi:acyl carrier protein